ncbi:F5 F8 type C domain containing protein [Asbolus verrucosus]|uniref:F5 F8 type C domain containing protein n=1 Tax=Asbolus verrucosus TaxID=1661398 RepID=A0A482W9C6_ASBVE|nr:F5 F8 type C domain containing protein [Asbolus verrucosus]
MDENIATPQHQAEAISGKDTAFLLTGNRDVGKYARHTIGDQNGITVKLATPAFINHIYMMLWDKEMRYYCYYVEVSLDQRKWKKVIDYSHSSCRSYQNLFLEEEIVQYIRVVGTHNTANNEFHLIFLEDHYKTSIPRIVNGVICPITNVATLDKKAIVIEGQVSI